MDQPDRHVDAELDAEEPAVPFLSDTARSAALHALVRTHVMLPRRAMPASNVSFAITTVDAEI